MAYLQIPQYKLNLDGTDYTDGLQSFNVKLRDSNYSTAHLTLDNQYSRFYDTIITKFTEVKLYVRDSGGDWRHLFGGYARELNPSINTTQGNILNVACKGYGSALDETHCNRDYGTESANPSYPQPWNIWTNVIADFVNKSFDDWATGHAASITDYSLITDNYANDLTYINNPYRKNIDVINHVCDIATAIAAGADAENPTTAGPHWIVDPEGYFLLGKIGDHAAGGTSPEARWPDWWNVDEAGSTLVEGVDFSDIGIIDKSSEFANHVILVTDLRKPSYDSVTDGAGCAALWGDDNLQSLAADAAVKIVGTHSLRTEVKGDLTAGYAYYPSTEDAGWNIDKMGGPHSIPRLNFYQISDSPTYTYEIRMFTTDHLTDYYYIPSTTWSEGDTDWRWKSIPIGSYWASDNESSGSAAGSTTKWLWNGNPDWANINGFCYKRNPSAAAFYVWLDDWHLSGKITRSARCSDNITANNEYQKTFLSRYAMDDMCAEGTPGTTDVGDAARTAKAELLRRIRSPRTVQFTVSMRPSIMAGQKTHVHAFRKLDGTYTINGDMRIMEVTHGFDPNPMIGAYSTITATDDLYNTRPISSTDLWALQQEFTLINSREAMNMRAGAEVDLLIPMLQENYT